MTNFCRLSCALIGISIFAIPAAARAPKPNDHKCDPYDHYEYVEAYDRWECFPNPRTFINGELLTIAPYSGSKQAIDEILEKLGGTVAGQSKKDPAGNNTLEIQGVTKEKLPQIINKLGLDINDVK